MSNINFTISGGLSPYKLLVDSIEYVYLTTGNKTISLEPGNYILILNDANNCIISKSVIVNE